MAQGEICIKVLPNVLIKEIAKVIQALNPGDQDIAEIQNQLLRRHIILGLGKKTAPEEVAEAYFRCIITDHVQRYYNVNLNELTSCINSSHTAVRGICIRELHHNHLQVSDSEWKKTWPRFKDKHKEVDVGEHNCRRIADLYFYTQGGIVSVEFKYLGKNGSISVNDCVTQMRRYAEKHAATMMIIYTDSTNDKEIRRVDELRSLLKPAVNVILVSGPAIQRFNTDDQGRQGGKGRRDGRAADGGDR